MAEIRSQEQYEKVKAALKEGRFADEPDAEEEVLAAAEAWKESRRGRGVAGMPSIVQGVTGAADMLATMGRGLAGTGAGLVGSALDPENAGQIFEQITENPRFVRPLATPEGQRIGERIAPPLERLELGIADTFEKVPGGPIAQTAARTAVQGTLELLGLRGIGAATKAATRSVQPPGTLIPTVDDLYSIGRVAFNEARIRGGGVRPEALERAARNIRNIQNDVGLPIIFDPDVHGPAFAVRRRLLNDLETGNVNFDELMSLREVASGVAGDKNPAISMRGMRMRNIIDDFVDSLGPDDVIASDPQRAAQALTQARQFWRDASAARTIEREYNLAGIDAEDFTGAGFENKLRIRFKQLSRRIEKGQERGFNADEIAAIRRVANGGPVENLFRYIGKAAPTGIVSFGIGSMLGHTLFGPAGAVAVPLAGAVGREVATRGTIANARRAMEIPLRASLLTP